MLKTKKIAVIGYGVMGEAILSGLIKKGGIDPKNITASGPGKTAGRNSPISTAFRLSKKTSRW